MNKEQSHKLHGNLKSQIQGQVFVYILAMIIIAFTLIYGYNAIRGFGEKANRVALITFKTDLESDVRSIMTDFGTVKKKTYDVPGEKVCFITLGKGNACTGTHVNNIPKICNPDMAGMQEYEPLIRNLWMSSEEQNVFVLPESDISIKTGKITLDGNRNGVEDDLESGDMEPCDTVHSQIDASDCYYMCTKTVSGRITLRLEGKGDHTFVSEWRE